MPWAPSAGSGPSWSGGGPASRRRRGPGPGDPTQSRPCRRSRSTAIATGRRPGCGAVAEEEPDDSFLPGAVDVPADEQGPLEPRRVDWSLGTPTSEGMRFRILRPHAQGGIGKVSVAFDAELQREVALKQIKPERADDADSRARFLLEAEVTGRLEHPGIVPVYGLGIDDERPAVLRDAVRPRDQLRGGDQRSSIRPTRTRAATRGSASLALRHLLDRFVDVCQTVAYAHSRGVLHRDLKPANVLLGPFNESLVVDWGLAKVFARGPGEPRGQQPATGRTRTDRRGAGADRSADAARARASGRGRRRSSGRRRRARAGSSEPPLGLLELDRDGGGDGVRHAGLHEPRAGRGPARPARARRATSTAWGRCSTPCWRPAAVRIRLVRRDGAARPGPAGRVPAAAAGQPARPPRAGGGLPQGDGRTGPRTATPRPPELAEEIERWLADEPVLAYREPAPARLARWGRRHKPIVAGAAALLLTAVAALSAGIVLVGREQRRTERQRLRGRGAAPLADRKSDEATERAESLRRRDAVSRVNLAYREYLDDNVALADELLDGCPADLRAWEWAYARRLGHSELRSWTGLEPRPGRLVRGVLTRRRADRRRHRAVGPGGRGADRRAGRPRHPDRRRGLRACAG